MTKKENHLKNERSFRSQIIKAFRKVEENKQFTVIDNYLDVEKGCMVKVYEGVQYVPYRTVPVGFREEDT